MSVLIKGMEMPDKCRHCRFSSDFDCAVTGHFIPTHSIRQLDCPLVEVPTPHGDLIDRDKLPIECITFSKRKMYRAGTWHAAVHRVAKSQTQLNNND